MEERKQLNLGWLEVPAEPSQEEQYPSFELEDEQPASSTASEASARGGEELSASAFSSSASSSPQKAGADYDELIQEEVGEDQKEEEAGTSRDAAEHEVNEDPQEISFPELDDLFSSPDGQAEPASEEEEAGGDIEPVLDFEPGSEEDGPSAEKPSEPASEGGEDEASQDELELDISSFIDDLEIEPEESGDPEHKKSGS
jgi:hypothetical protein